MAGLVKKEGDYVDGVFFSRGAASGGADVLCEDARQHRRCEGSWGEIQTWAG